MVLSGLAKTSVKEARLVAEPDRVLLLRISGVLCSRSPALRLQAAPVALRTRPGRTSSP